LYLRKQKKAKKKKIKLGNHLKLTIKKKKLHYMLFMFPSFQTGKNKKEDGTPRCLKTL